MGSRAVVRAQVGGPLGPGFPLLLMGPVTGLPVFGDKRWALWGWGPGIRKQAPVCFLEQRGSHLAGGVWPCLCLQGLEAWRSLVRVGTSSLSPQ